MGTEGARRTGDAIAISGAYQYRALHEGPAVQRFWHHNKQLTIERYLPPGPGDLVLDVGCGSGVVADFLARTAGAVVGVDASHDAIEFARRTFARENLSFRRGLVDEAFQVGRPVDKVYCLELVEHVHRHQAADMLRLFHDRLAPGGRLYLTTPNYRSPWPVIEWLMDALRLAPPMKDHQHVTRYHRGSLRGLCEEAGFSVEVLSTTCLLAPWLAPLSWKLALRANALETGGALGCILVCVARKDIS